MLAAVTFAAAIGVGTMMGPEITGRQVMANAAPFVPPVSANAQAAVGAHPAEVLRVLDGDTFEARVRVWPGLEVTTKIQQGGGRAGSARNHAG
jgi:hypothetical protein